MSVIKLTKPFVVDGKEHTEFNLDYDSATGVIVQKAERLARKKYGLTDMYLPASDTYRMIFASLMLKIPVDALENLPLRDYQAVANDVLIFFGGSASDDMTGPETGETPEMIS